MTYDEAFADRYDDRSAHMTEDVGLYVELALQAGRGLTPPGRPVRMERLRVRPKVAAEQDGRHKDDPVPNTIHYDVADNRIDNVLDEGKTSSLWWATRTSGSA